MLANCDNARNPQQEAPGRRAYRRRPGRQRPRKLILNANLTPPALGSAVRPSGRAIQGPALNTVEQLHTGGISVQHYLMLEGVARRLARKYPPDWLERHWGALYAGTLALTFLLAVLLALAWSPWWSVLVPLLGPTVVLVALPRLLFGRTPGHPRWAHRLATLDRQDAALVRSLLGIDDGAPLSGERFFDLWRRARCVVEYRRA